MGDENPIRTQGDYSKTKPRGLQEYHRAPRREQRGTSSIRHHPDGAKRMLIPRSISTWEDLTTRFLAQLFPLGRTAKLRNDILMQTIDQSAGGKLRNLNAEESWALLEVLALYDNESWNDPRDFAKPVKAIALPQDLERSEKIDGVRVQVVLKEYNGPRYEIETRLMNLSRPSKPQSSITRAGPDEVVQMRFGTCCRCGENGEKDEGLRFCTSVF
ncbi:hypothetical protein Tco_1069023 [Tanacetum coccineum]|uniref:MAK10-like protein n=1 Tax=Tanacetum coccineum TaxID=301880 RepID=A0ABQ5HHJ3_9ASTR